MPHAVFELGSLSATTEAIGRPLVPGIEPGGSRGGAETKPALLIRDCWAEVIDIGQLGGGVAWNQMSYYLKLSQETDMTPGLLLPISTVGSELRQADATGESLLGVGAVQKDLFHAQGTVWAPRLVGVRAVEVGGLTLNVRIHLDYERVDVPWMDWFIMWDFLDNVVDNELEY